MINLHRRNQTQKGRKIRTTEIPGRATDFNKRLIQAFNSDGAKQPEDVSDTRDDQLDDDFPEPGDDRKTRLTAATTPEKMKIMLVGMTQTPAKLQ
ncbi:hypothetical protein CGCSCA5_v008026 [Colletotrichum siamense]|nr:hypothetical protein CGCSCA5_v008026 [Colletotrichum siamense]